MTIYDQINALPTVNEGRTSGHDSSHDTIALGLQDYVTQLNHLNTLFASKAAAWQGGVTYPAGSVVTSPTGDLLYTPVMLTSDASYDNTEKIRWQISPSFLQTWAPSTPYALGARVVNPNGDVVRAKAAHTSGTSYSVTNWTLPSTYLPSTDPSVTNARTPLAHAASHSPGGTDDISAAYLPQSDPRLARLPAPNTGATASTRYAGGTVSGPPTTGTFSVGDFVVDQQGTIWVCITAGTPGTWVQGDLSRTTFTNVMIGAPYVVGTGTVYHDIGSVVVTTLASGAVVYGFPRTYKGIMSMQQMLGDNNGDVMAVYPIGGNMQAMTSFNGVAYASANTIAAGYQIRVNYEVWGWA